VIQLSEHPNGLLLPVRAQPGARKAGVLGEQAGALKLGVTAPPQDGRANAAVVELVRELLGLKRSQVELVTGLKARNKMLLIRSVPRADLAERISRLLA
jgi:uncharacterized protein (TIGR00251 family)